ncbi:MAG: tyrosine-type recombinase/integrase [Hyphomicrobiales bacterium]|nr:tyrosine-type recombinase/integrase [Hyphomicrobiales bacterium]
MPQHFTDLMLRKLNPEGQARSEIWDGRIPGFGVRVSGTGTKTFILMYRHRGRTRRLSLGRYPYLSLMQAREKATLALREVSNGNDPALIAEADDSPSFQFDAVVDRFIERHCHIHNKASTAKETTRLLKKHFVGVWGKRDIRDIRQTHINAILDALVAEDKPSEANHALGVIKTLFQWCVDRDMLTISPCLKVKKPAKHGSRARVLSESELKAVWKVFDAEGYPLGDMAKLLVLTAQRRGEVTQMRWSQIDLEAKTWTIPAAISKNGREHLLPLSSHAVAVLKSLPRLHKDLLFPARGNDNAVISGFSRGKIRFDKLSGVSDWTLHDLRRTTATFLGKLDTPPHVIERILNHVSGSFAGVAGVYNRHPYLDEMRIALEKWGVFMNKINTTQTR